MGKLNRQRRAAKRQARESAGSARPADAHRNRRRYEGGETRFAGGPPPVTSDVVASAATRAIGAFRSGRRPEFDRVCSSLAVASAADGGSLAVDAALFGLLEGAVTEAWRQGWQPADLGPVLRKLAGARPARITADVVVHEAQRYAAVTLAPRWRQQLDALNAPVWWDTRCSYLDQLAGRERTTRLIAITATLEALAVLSSLPPQPILCPRPGEAPPPGSRPDPSSPANQAGGGGAGHGRMLTRVRALLAKAESTTFPSEAEALTAKAQELMARHAIDQAMLDARAPHQGGPVGRRIPVDDPYAGAKAALASTVADANRCRVVFTSALGFLTVFGHEADVDGVELLFTSLLIQATAALTAAGRDSAHGKGARTSAFRRSFMMGYAARIGQRLAAASQASTASAAATHGESLLPVLASRVEAVDRTVEATFPTLSSYSVSVSNGAGWATGQAAGAVAQLGVHAEMNR